jgi:hypothetical protein
LRSGLFNVSLIRILLKDRPSDGVLYPEEQSKLQTYYLDHHDKGQTAIFMEHVNNCANMRTTELVMDAILGWETSLGHNQIKFEALQCLKDSATDVELRGWLFKNIDRGVGYDIMRVLWISVEDIKRNLACCFNCPKISQISSLIFKVSKALMKIGLFYFDFFKDIVAFTILYHISSEILVR